MDTNSSTTALQELLAAVSDPKIRRSVSALVEASISAVTAMARLDENIFAMRKQVSVAKLVAVADETLGKVRDLEQAIDIVDLPISGEDGDREEENEECLDFDFDTSSPAAPGPETAALTLDASDIDDAFETFGAIAGQSCEERWLALRSDINSLSYGLGSRLRDFDLRFADALEGQRFPQALHELDDCVCSLTDGVFELMTSMYQAFLPAVDPNRFIPGHRDTLSRALAVRKGLADLRRAIGSRNALVQDPDASVQAQEQALAQAARELDQFAVSDVFILMRSQDRCELENFQKELAQPSRPQARSSCEGLDKYLDSLAAVSQRDVLIKHDTAVKEDIAELLEGVAPLLHISPHGAASMVAQAFASAESLYGLQVELDELAAEWSSLPQETRDPERAAQMGQRLQALVCPQHRTALGSDFF